MGYKVIHAFTDSQDFRHIYSVGDVFPRSGIKVTEERIKELASAKNKQKKALIALVESDFSNKTNQTEKEELPFVTVPNKKNYTKTEINRMPTAELKQMALDNGVENADTMTGTELKKYFIELFEL